MKKRIIFILCFLVIGILCIEIYIRTHQKVNYQELSYKIIYEEKEENSKEELEKRKYYTYYFVHFDPKGKVQFENKDTFLIKEAYEKGYIFLGDLLKQINIDKEYTFTLKAHVNEEQELARKIVIDDYHIYYYKINDIQINANATENLLEVLKRRDLKINDLLTYMERNFTKEKIKKEDIYQMNELFVYINEHNIYFGNEDLKKEVGETKWK